MSEGVEPQLCALLHAEGLQRLSTVLEQAQMSLSSAIEEFRQGRPRFLSNLSRLGMHKLSDRQVFANAVSRAAKAQRIAASANLPSGRPPVDVVLAIDSSGEVRLLCTVRSLSQTRPDRPSQAMQPADPAAHSSKAHTECRLYPALPLDSFRAQNLFHQIDLNFPGLQLVHQNPFVFIVRDFLTAAECETLIHAAHAASAAAMAKSANDEHCDSFAPAWDAVRDLRHRFARLANVGLGQMQPLKITEYAPGERFARHLDAVPCGEAHEPDHDAYNDKARLREGPACCPYPGGNRHVTILVYLNTVHSGGCTCWRWTQACPVFYDKPVPSGQSVLSRPSGAPLCISPELGMAVVHFPATVPHAGGYTDVNAAHEGEATDELKVVCQQFIWSHELYSDGSEVGQIEGSLAAPRVNRLKKRVGEPN
mmetsp:Transcript_30926/g.51214  ORF Transcript_30926/g.51214 Transcript_30926/m.51214 type:complete len:423 (-) Transcript_30926:155-1423(-)